MTCAEARANLHTTNAHKHQTYKAHTLCGLECVLAPLWAVLICAGLFIEVMIHAVAVSPSLLTDTLLYLSLSLSLLLSRMSIYLGL